MSQPSAITVVPVPRREAPRERTAAAGAARAVPSMIDFHDVPSPDLFEKCRRFLRFTTGLEEQGVLQTQYRVELLGPLDHRITVRDPEGGGARELICFDSNSYLGLHLHPRVVGAVRQALGEVGYGTPSAQLLCGTSRHLRELEDEVSAFYGRADTVVFPSGYAANVGALTGLLRKGDLAARDRFSHASIHDGCRWSGARLGGTYAHRDTAALAALLERDAPAANGRLVVTDGVFSMHGRLAPLPDLRAVADRFGARLMVDEAHSVGVIGASGRGLEELFAMPGSIDVLMGTFSKAPGGLGGYVTGSRELISYLRFFARSAMFTASLPAPICAGLAEAFRVMDRESEHRERLWANARRFHRDLCQAGLEVGSLESPILTLPIGPEPVLWQVSGALFRAGLKCGSVSFPAVPRGASILRLTVNARHTSEDLDRAVEMLSAVLRRLAPAAVEASS